MHCLIKYWGGGCPDGNIHHRREYIIPSASIVSELQLHVYHSEIYRIMQRQPWQAIRETNVRAPYHTSTNCCYPALQPDAEEYCTRPTRQW